LPEKLSVHPGSSQAVGKGDFPDEALEKIPLLYSIRMMKLSAAKDAEFALYLKLYSQ
jgi:hypothetical protein